ncbi:MAG: hypothetical protein NTY77_08335 [Elusimicrobia bacterium]|nr:hypothetical protein [Elusimicrobiota bacterium]
MPLPHEQSPQPEPLARPPAPRPGPGKVYEIQPLPYTMFKPWELFEFSGR